MTVCIAALCEDFKTIVTASDKMISNDFVARESGLTKFAHITEKWAFSFSASDVTPLSEIMRGAHAAFSDHDGTVEDARSKVIKVYQDIRLKRAEARFLAPRGWNLDQFIKEGLKLLGEMTFTSIERRIHEFDLGVELLVVGFDSDGIGHIFSVEHPGIAEDRSVPGFHAIGSGSLNAMSSLYQRNLNPASYLPPVVYYVYEAKKYAEKNGSVGDETSFSIFRADGRVEAGRGRLAILESIWDRVKPRDLDGSMVDGLLKNVELLKILPETK